MVSSLQPKSLVLFTIFYHERKSFLLKYVTNSMVKFLIKFQALNLAQIRVTKSYKKLELGTFDHYLIFSKYSKFSISENLIIKIKADNLFDCKQIKVKQHVCSND
ncbi:hypothetical protein BpHYR1_009404 [Brachionus plicatilis]|uniref:Uncharacterized protein n=1 Tax=Brachionus plicatilis TaxID=10195 RepID=A0A3M7RMC5_BRAPC|nr:hypothetical protein BpHYR1_009404 [Brachionus plicatilis]